MFWLLARNPFGSAPSQLTNVDGELVILKTGREKQLIGKIDFYTPVYCSPVIANNTLFVTTHTHLFAVGK